MKKVLLAAQLIEKRIAFADHVVAGLPSERQLSDDLGLSRNTVRKALQYLVDQGTLKRQENGRLDVAPAVDKPRTRTIGFVAPVGTSHNRDKWREGLTSVVRTMANDQPIVIRSVTYAHWADPVIQEALAGFDGAFFMCGVEALPRWLMSKIKESNCRVLSLAEDYSADGVPSILLFPPTAEYKLFDHLYRLGHRHIDCLNTQAEDPVIRDRIKVWKEYLDPHGVQGQLHSLTQSNPIESAYCLVRDALQDGSLTAPALFCTTGPGAIGAMRALSECGLKIGHDVSVCAVNSEGLGRYLLPSLTALEAPPRTLYLRYAVEWMIGEREWQGPLLLQPEDAPLFEGESTGPVPKRPLASSISRWRAKHPLAKS